MTNVRWSTIFLVKRGAIMLEKKDAKLDELSQEDKNKNAVKEILRICEDLDIDVDSNTEIESNKFLSAWQKRIM